MSATAVSVTLLAESLARALERPVEDHTAIEGLYDITLEWAPDQRGDSAEPSIFSALREQFGLKLDSARVPVEVIVIDSAERAMEN